MFENYGEFKNFIKGLNLDIQATVVTASTTVTALVPRPGFKLLIFGITANTESWSKPQNTGVFFISDGGV